MDNALVRAQKWSRAAVRVLVVSSASGGAPERYPPGGKCPREVHVSQVVVEEPTILRSAERTVVRVPVVVGTRAARTVEYVLPPVEVHRSQVIDAMFVIGAPNSSNSLRLVEVAEREGIPARLIQRADEIDLSWLQGIKTLGITAGASAPEVLVREVVATLSSHFTIIEDEVRTVDEHMIFKLPRSLAAA